MEAEAKQQVAELTASFAQQRAEAREQAAGAEAKRQAELSTSLTRQLVEGKEQVAEAKAAAEAEVKREAELTTSLVRQLTGAKEAPGVVREAESVREAGAPKAAGQQQRLDELTAQLARS
eukprot:5053521-Prymnesium_polylepis.1